MVELLAQLTGIQKSFAGHAVLEDVDFELRSGEVHVLAGENGAGKSTLIRILGGVLTADRGTVRVAGRECRFRTVQDAAEAGVAIIHQELSLAPALSIADNLFLGRERTGPFGIVRAREQRREASALLSRVGVRDDPRTIVGSLPIATRQLVEIAKALGQDARILAMDEPTSSLARPDAERLFALVEELSASGVGVVFITHRMEEIYRLAKRISVLRDGRMVLTSQAELLPRDALVRAMVGRDVDEQVQRQAVVPGDEALAVDAVTMWNRAGRVLDRVALSVRAGEVLGIAGLAGSGASELLHALFGDGPARLDGLRIRGRPAHVDSPRTAISQGIALVTADRKQTGLCLSSSVADNVTLAALRRLSPGGLRRPRRETDAAARSIDALRIACRSSKQSVRILSGGNQQKVALAKWLETRPRVLLLDEPTRGIDVGAKQEIYALIDRLAAAGMAILLVSSELPELLGLADRLIVLHRGRVTAEFARETATPERVIAAALGDGLEGGAA